jgi:hypothetical protein
MTKYSDSKNSPQLRTKTMQQKPSILFMSGFSSQRDMLINADLLNWSTSLDVGVPPRFVTIASHRDDRFEIKLTADFHLSEPERSPKMFPWLKSAIEVNNIKAIHVGQDGKWFEIHRELIETLGVSLTTGAKSINAFHVADQKSAFTALMAEHELAVVPCHPVSSKKELLRALENNPFNMQDTLCIKPDVGVYGAGFWILDRAASSFAHIQSPSKTRIQPEKYIECIDDEHFKTHILMPHFSGVEHSIDILASNGKVLGAIGRRKEGKEQYLVNDGPAVELAIGCAEILGADGVINVQTINDKCGTPHLLEANLRPSGGFGYTINSNVNIAGLFSMLKLGLMTEEMVTRHFNENFTPARIRSVTETVVFDESEYLARMVG